MNNIYAKGVDEINNLYLIIILKEDQKSSEKIIFFCNRNLYI